MWSCIEDVILHDVLWRLFLDNVLYVTFFNNGICVGQMEVHEYEWVW